MILANPMNWFPWVDQVDRPYFIAIDKHNKIYSEFTDFSVANPVTAQSNNWYELVDKDNLKYFIIKGRFGYYYLEMDTGLFFVDCQHEAGNHPIQTHIYGLKILDTIITGDERPYQLRHFKLSDIELMTGAKEILRGMNCSPTPIVPKHSSQTSDLVFGWQVEDEFLGRITFEGRVSNRIPRFFLRLLYTPLKDIDGNFASIIRFNVTARKEHNMDISGKVNKGEKIFWEHRVI